MSYDRSVTEAVYSNPKGTVIVSMGTEVGPMGKNLSRVLTLILIVIIVPLTTQLSEGPATRSTAQAFQYYVCVYVQPPSINGNYSIGGNVYHDGDRAPIDVGVNYTLNAYAPVATHSDPG